MSNVSCHGIEHLGSSVAACVTHVPGLFCYPYGFGWMLVDVNGHRLVHHPGGMPGARADIARFVDDGLTIIITMNLDDVDINTIVAGVAKLYLPTRVPANSR